MAEITSNQQKQRKGVNAKRKILSTKVDLTPMVDLGFLLITFFVFTTTMSRPTAMGLIEPNDSDTVITNIPESLTTTFLLAANDAVYYKHGLDKEYLQTDYSANGIRRVIENKKQKLGTGRRDSVIVVIKPSDASDLKNFIDVTDELKITCVKVYFTDTLKADDKAFLALH